MTQITVSEQRKNEALKQEEARVAQELKAKQEADEKARVDAKLKAKLEAEAKVSAKAALLAATKKSQDLAKKLNVGKSCTKQKSGKTVSGVKFICVKKGTKLVWALR